VGRAVVSGAGWRPEVGVVAGSRVGAPDGHPGAPTTWAGRRALVGVAGGSGRRGWLGTDDRFRRAGPSDDLGGRRAANPGGRPGRPGPRCQPGRPARSAGPCCQPGRPARSAGPVGLVGRPARSDPAATDSGIAAGAIRPVPGGRVAVADGRAAGVWHGAKRFGTVSRDGRGGGRNGAGPHLGGGRFARWPRG
jgi:hypothetical protein